MNSTHSPYCRGADGRSTQPAGRGFSTVELAVSLTLFLFISLFVSLAVARSLGAQAQAKSVRAGESVAADTLSKLAATPYEDLVGGSFTAPDPCPGSGVGVNATTCATVGNTTVTVAYSYLDADMTCSSEPNGSATAGSAFVGLCARVTEINGNPPPSSLQPVVRFINAPGPGYDLNNQAVVRVAVSSSSLPPSSLGYNVSLVRNSARNAPVKTVPINPTAMAAYISVPAATCTEADPCTVVMNPCLGPCAPWSDGAVGFYGTATGPDARIVTAADTITETSLAVEKLPAVSLNLSARNGEVSTPLTASASLPSVTDTVCLWLTAASSPASAAAICNSDPTNPSTITASTYVDPGTGLTLPLPLGAATLTVDSPTSVCGAPGQQGITVSGAARPAPVCTSWTWGQPSQMPRTFTFTPGQADVADVVWVAGADGAASPAAGWPGNPAPAWNYPRPIPDLLSPPTPHCTVDGTCTPVLVAPEATLCPGQHCLSTTTPTPYLVRPLTAQVVGVGQRGTFPVAAYNPAGGGTMHVYTAEGPGLTGRVLPAGGGELYLGTQAVPSAPGSLLASSAGQLANFNLTYARPTNYTAAVTINVRLCPAPSTTPATCPGGATRSMTVLEGSPFGLLSFQPVTGYTAAQGQTTSVTVKLLDPVTGLAMSGREIVFDFRDAADPAAAGPYRTGIDGTVTVPITVRNTATSTTITASTVAVGNQGSTTAAASLTVLQTPRNLALAAAGPSPLLQNGAKNFVATATDAGGNPVAGVTVTGAVTNADSVTPATLTAGGCLTGADGTCLLSVSAAADANPGTYFVRATFPGVTSSTVPVTVAQALRTAVFTSGTPSLAQNSGPIPATLLLTDASGSALADTADIVVTGTAAVGPAVPGSSNPLTATVATGQAGTADLNLYASPASTVGTTTMTVTQRVAGLGPEAWPTATVSVAVTPGNITLTTVGTPTVAQNGSAQMTVKAANAGGVGQSGKVITLVPANPALTAAEATGGVVTTGAGGTATFTIDAALTLPAGTVNIVATTPGSSATPLPVTVTPTVTTMTVGGAVPQGGTGPLTVKVLDGAGAPMTGVTVSLNPVVDGAATVLSFSPASAVTAGADPSATLNGTNTPAAAARTWLATGTAGGTAFTNIPVAISPVVNSVVANPTSLAATVATPSSSVATATDLVGAALPGATATVRWVGANPTGPDGWNPIGVFTGTTVPAAPAVPRPPDIALPLPTTATTATDGKVVVFAQPSLATKAGAFTAEVVVNTGGVERAAAITVTFTAGATAPVINSITGGNRTATIAFTPPASTGGTAITNYQYSNTPNAVVGRVALANTLGNRSTYNYNTGGVNFAGANDTVRVVAMQPNNRPILGGAFTTYNGVTRGGIVRLTATGTQDTTFATGLGFAGPDGTPATVRAIAIQSDGKVVVGGTFTSYNNTLDPANAVPVSNLARLTSTGTLDTTFNANPPAGAERGTDGAVTALRLDAAGNILVGGAFTTYNDTPAANLLRLTPTGTVDTSFTGGPDGPVTAIAANPDGTWLIGGAFATYRGTEQANLARIGADGTLDPSYTASPNGPVAALAVQPDGKAIIGGAFTNLPGAPNGGVVGNLARLNADGTVDTTWAANAAAGANGAVAAIGLTTDGKAIIGGNFTTYAGGNAVRLGRVNANGTRDSTFNNTGTGANAFVYGLALTTTNTTVFGGAFTTFNDVWTNRSPAATTSPWTIGSLTNGTTYYLRIRAVNAQGAGAPSNVVPVTPAATVPSAPTLTAVTGGNGTATATFTAPSTDGGSAITNYEYSTDNGATWTPRSPAATTSPLTITGLTNYTTYQVRLRAVNAVGAGAASAALPVTPKAPGAVFVPVTPTRAYDSRTADGALSAGASRNVDLTAGGVPDGAVAAAYNVTAVSPAAAMTLTTTAANQAATGGTVTVSVPAAAVNTANATTTPVDPTASIKVTAAGSSTQFLVDVVGYYAPEATTPAGGAFTPITPNRVYDSRTAGAGGTSVPLTGDTNRLISVAGAGVPTGATAVAVNITVAEQNGAGSASVTPGNVTTTTTSLINWPAAGTTRANAVTVGLDTSRQIRVYANSATTAVIVDVVGYFTPANTSPDAGRYFPTAPARAYTTTGGAGAFGANTNRVIGLSGAGVPVGALAAPYTVTVFGQTSIGSAWSVPANLTTTTTSLLNWGATNYALSNTVSGGVDASAQVRVNNTSAGQTGVAVDVSGYYR